MNERQICDYRSASREDEVASDSLLNQPKEGESHGLKFFMA